MEDVGLEETKPDVDVDVKVEDDAQPEPDETLMMDQGNGKVWSVKLPKHLMENWSSVSKDGIHLASLRVYDADPKTRKQRMVLLVPSEPRDPDDPASMKPPVFAPDTYDEYEVEMLNDAVDNQIVVAEREKEAGSRARTTILTGRVRHDCSLRPTLTDRYLRRMKERNRVANTPKRSVLEMDEKEAGGIGRMNRLGSGMGTAGASFSSFIAPKQKQAKGQFERFARMPRNQLLDMLFALFREQPRWSAKDLRARTEQPESYLKEVLQQIADLHRSGEFTGTYELKSMFRDTVKAESGEYSGAAGELMKTEPDEENYDDDEDEEDEDMEEVS